MLFRVVDDRSGTSYQEYRCAYSNDVGSGLHFLFNAMAPIEGDKTARHGIPEAIYLDNGLHCENQPCPVSTSASCALTMSVYAIPS